MADAVRQTSLVKTGQTAEQRNYRHKESHGLRTTMANNRRNTVQAEYNPETQQPNRDEYLYSPDNPAYQGNSPYYACFSKCLEHNEIGEVAKTGYQALLQALGSGSQSDFAAIPLAIRSTLTTASVRLTNPQSGLAFDLEGADPHFFALPPAPAFNSARNIAEIAELYWMAICRDVPFAHYATDERTKAAVADLNRYQDRDYVPSGTQVTAATLFRDNSAGARVGPYLSQFIIRDVPFGPLTTSARLAFGVLGNTGADDEAKYRNNYMTDEASYLRAQRGWVPELDGILMDNVSGLRTLETRALPDSLRKVLHDGRGLANYVHIDELYQTYLNACMLLIAPIGRGGFGAKPAAGNPYLDAVAGKQGHSQTGGATLGMQDFANLLAAVSTRALKAVWYQKWFVHRRLRPEVFAARIHWSTQLEYVEMANRRTYDFHAAELAKLKEGPLKQTMIVASKGFLPMAFPEGSPAHPSYGAGHATVSGACITVLKALFDGSQPIATPLVTGASNAADVKPLQPKADGSGLETYTGADAAQMTIGGELDKLAANICMARNFAGVHWRSDNTESFRLGEKVAQQFLQDIVDTYHEAVQFSWTTRDGKAVTVAKKYDPASLVSG